MIKNIRKTFKNKIIALSLVGSGIISIWISGDDVSYLMFTGMIGTPLFLAKENCFY